MFKFWLESYVGPLDINLNSNLCHTNGYNSNKQNSIVSAMMHASDGNITDFTPSTNLIL